MFNKNSFMLQPSVVAGVGVLLTAFLFTTYISISDYHFTNRLCDSVGCLEKFLSHFKHPLWIMSGLVSYLVIINLLFRTTIAEKTLNYSLEQNTFSNYFEHRKQFIEYIADNDKLTKLISDPKRTHRLYYPLAGKGSFEFNQEIIYSITKNAAILRFLICKQNFSSTQSATISNAILEICNALNIRELGTKLESLYEAQASELDATRTKNSNESSSVDHLFLPECTYFTCALNKASCVNDYIREIFLFYPQGITNELIENPLGMDFAGLEREQTIWFHEEYSKEIEISRKRRIENYEKPLYESSKPNETVKTFYKRKTKRHNKANT